jgi:hypothetical protein
MSNIWLAAENVARAEQAIRAINTLSIHAKLLLRQHPDEGRKAEVETSRATLRRFLDQLVPLIEQAESTRAGEPLGLVTGGDPRMSQLATTVAVRRRQWPQTSPLYTRPLADLRRELVTDLEASLVPEARERLQRVIDALRELRTLIEQSARTDAISLLGQI